MADSLRDHIKVTQPKRLDVGGETESPKSGPVSVSLEQAKSDIGGSLRDALRGTGTALKQCGDPSQVLRFCDGEVPSILARAWQDPVTRMALLRAMAKRSGLFIEQVSLHSKAVG